MFNHKLRSFSSLLKSGKKDEPVSCNPGAGDATVSGNHTDPAIARAHHGYDKNSNTTNNNVSNLTMSAKKNLVQYDWWIN